MVNHPPCLTSSYLILLVLINFNLVVHFSVGNMMESVVLDGNPLDEDNGNLLDEVVLDLMNLLNYVNLMYLQ